jgi:hypothetical protein
MKLFENIRDPNLMVGKAAMFADIVDSTGMKEREPEAGSRLPRRARRWRSDSSCRRVCRGVLQRDRSAVNSTPSIYANPPGEASVASTQFRPRRTVRSGIAGSGAVRREEP